MQRCPGDPLPDQAVENASERRARPRHASIGRNVRRVGSMDPNYRSRADDSSVGAAAAGSGFVCRSMELKNAVDGLYLGWLDQPGVGHGH